MTLQAADGGPIKPIFIVGAPGSGTTLLYQTLSSHRDLAYITHNLLRSGIRKHGRIVGDRRKALFMLQKLIHRDVTSNLPDEADAFWMTFFDYYNYMSEIDYTDEMAAYFRRKVLQIQRLYDRPRFINKNLQNSFRVRLLNAIFSDAKFIHIIRDGRAVAFSILNKKAAGATSAILQVGFKDILRDKYDGNRSELYNYGLAWVEYVTRAREAGAFGENRYHEIRYENLVADTRNELKRIIEFCELDWYSEFEEKIPKVQNMNEKWRQKANEQQHKDMEESTITLRQTLGFTQ